jgi:hypothetical protein
MKSVYLIKSLEDGYYKIGTSKNPNIRLEKLQTGNPSTLKLITSYKSDLANKIERTLHRKYKTLRKEGEWFDLQLIEEQNFINDCQRIENNLIILKNSGNIFT